MLGWYTRVDHTDRNGTIEKIWIIQQMKQMQFLASNRKKKKLWIPFNQSQMAAKKTQYICQYRTNERRIKPSACLFRNKNSSNPTEKRRRKIE
jgi:hypothetical protein